MDGSFSSSEKEASMNWASLSGSIQNPERACSYSRQRTESKARASLLPGIQDLSSAEVRTEETAGSAEENGQQVNGENFVAFDFSNVGSSRRNTEVESLISERVITAQSSKALESHNSEIKNAEQEACKHQKREDDFFSTTDTNWKTMSTVSEQDYYNERGDLEFQANGDWRDLVNLNAIGYTKVGTEEQVAKFAEFDRQTDFLFQRTLPGNDESTKSDVTKFSDGEDSEYEEEDQLESAETLGLMENSLMDVEKFAYVGIVKLLVVEMATELAKVNQCSSKRVAKAISLAQRNFANWTMYVMSKLYDHMHLTLEEQKMIENLSLHGLEVNDLSKKLKQMDIIQNPFARTINSSDNAEQNNGKEKSYLTVDLRWTLICDLVLVLLSDGYYDSRSRNLIMKFADELGIPTLAINQFERRLLQNLELESQEKSIQQKDELINDRRVIKKYIRKNRNRKYAYIGLAALGGSLVMGLSAGLLAPVIGAGVAAGLTTVGITGTSGFLAGVGGSTIITSGGVLVGARIGSMAGAKRADDIHTFELKPLYDTRRPNLVLTVCGWMNGQADDVRLPFSTIDPIMGDIFSLLWEPDMLRSMGQTIQILASEALVAAINLILGATILSALMAALQLPMALTKLSYLIDNPWNVSLDRAWKAGKILADTLISGNLGVRPITLVGFSLGSRLIYSCLIELSKRGGYGLIDNVILIGSPLTAKKNQLALAKTVVSGRFVNVYSKKDWILGYLFRATSGGIASVAGLSPINNVYGIENMDCTEFIHGHMSYRKAIPKILKKLDWEVLSEDFVEIEEPDPAQTERQRKLIIEFDEAKSKYLKEQAKTGGKKRSWKDYFKPRSDWFSFHGEANNNDQALAGSDEHNSQMTNDAAIFDLEALAKEAHQIEIAGQKDPEQLQQMREDVEPLRQSSLSNEDLE